MLKGSLALSIHEKLKKKTLLKLPLDYESLGNVWLWLALIINFHEILSWGDHTPLRFIIMSDKKIAIMYCMP